MPDPAVHAYDLLPGVVARVQGDGSLLVDTGPASAPALAATVESLVDGRRRRGPAAAPFTAVVSEGAPGGQRGFSAQRDDDQDGAVDEDRLDGIDNDGDGLLDEDYAAISESMVVVDLDGRQPGGDRARLEYYHWPYPRLRSAVFVTVASQAGGAGPESYRLALDGQAWQEAIAISVGHTVSGQPRSGQVAAFVARVPRGERSGATGSQTACDPAFGLWLGVLVLSEAPAGRPVIDGSILSLPLGPEALTLAVCSAESWLQLADRLNAAARVYAGVSDPVTGQQARLIVPPACVPCRRSELPSISWQRTAGQGLVLTAHVTATSLGALDPDLFRVAGQPLGAPQEILWVPQEGQAVSVIWSCRAATELVRPAAAAHPYGHLVGLGDHHGSGRLQFRFADTGEGPGQAIDLSTQPLTGSTLDGRSFTAVIKSSPPAPRERHPAELLVTDAAAGQAAATAGGDPAATLKAGRHGPTLSPALLEGYPNPFRDVIQLRFTVPATQGEAFVWDKNEAPPAGFDPQAAVPWRGGVPRISLKIYSLGGQELVTLLAADQGPGPGTLQWTGTDSHGRQVASGTYFCKLQIDEWSVTRRLVFLR